MDFLVDSICYYVDMPIGFSVIFDQERGTPFYTKLLTDMKDMGCDALEVHSPKRDGFEQTPELVHLMRKFGYLSIHAPDFVNEQESGRDVAYFASLAREIGAMAITAHPHAMRDAGWSWLQKHLGSLVSFENMDWRKPFGLSPDEMQKVFDEYPDARFTYDINHTFTLDSELKLNDDYTDLLAGRSGHYHISGFAGDQLPHTTLHTMGQDEIIRAIKTDDPVIIESYGLHDIEKFGDEYAYVTKVL